MAGTLAPGAVQTAGQEWVFGPRGASVGFLTRYDGELREPLMWYRGSQIFMRVARVRKLGCGRWKEEPDACLEQDSFFLPLDEGFLDLPGN